MRTKIIIPIVVIATAIVLVAFLSSFGPLLKSASSEPLSIQQIRSVIQKVGGESVIEKEATEAIRRFRAVSGSAGSDLTNCPSIDKMAALMEGEVLGIWDGVNGVDLPDHIRIRRGTHSNYQFIYILAAGSSPAPNTSDIQFVSRSVYLRNTGP
jgi:hypothetical protein